MCISERPFSFLQKNGQINQFKRTLKRWTQKKRRMESFQVFSFRPEKRIHIANFSFANP